MKKKLVSLMAVAALASAVVPAFATENTETPKVENNATLGTDADLEKELGTVAPTPSTAKETSTENPGDVVANELAKKDELKPEPKPVPTWKAKDPFTGAVVELPVGQVYKAKDPKTGAVIVIEGPAVMAKDEMKEEKKADKPAAKEVAKADTKKAEKALPKTSAVK